MTNSDSLKKGRIKYLEKHAFNKQYYVIWKFIKFSYSNNV